MPWHFTSSLSKVATKRSGSKSTWKMILKWLMMARCFHGLKMFPRVTPNILWYDFITWTLCTQKAIAPLPYCICLTHAFLIACFLASWTVLDFEITPLHRIQRPTEKNTHNLPWQWKSPSLCWEKIPFLDSWCFFAFPFQMTEITIPESRASFGSCFFFGWNLQLQARLSSSQMSNSRQGVD